MEILKRLYELGIVRVWYNSNEDLFFHVDRKYLPESLIQNLIRTASPRLHGLDFTADRTVVD
jgi:hypothetical protein